MNWTYICMEEKETDTKLLSTPKDFQYAYMLPDRLLPSSSVFPLQWGKKNRLANLLYSYH